MLKKKLDYTAAVLRLRSAIFATNAIRGMYDFSVLEWDRLRNAATDQHLIKGVLSGNEKSSAITEYVAKLVRVYMGIVGSLPGTLSKESLAGENAVTVTIVKRLGGMKIDTNLHLFELVCSRLLGIDDNLVKAACTADQVRYAHIMRYLVGALGEEFEEISYNQPADFLANANSAGQLNDEFFEDLIVAGTRFYEINPETDISLIDVLDDRLYEVSLDIKRRSAQVAK